MRTNRILYALYALSAAYMFTMSSFTHYQPTNDQFPTEEAPLVRTIELIPRTYGAVAAVSSTGAIFIRNNNYLFASFAADSGKMLFNFGKSSFYASAKSGNTITYLPSQGTSGGQTYALSPDGRKKWSLPLQTYSGIPVFSNHPEQVWVTSNGNVAAVSVAQQ